MNKRRISALGFTACLTDWADMVGVDRRQIGRRIDKYGWDAERAVTTPAGSKETFSSVVIEGYKEQARLNPKFVSNAETAAVNDTAANMATPTESSNNLLGV